MEMVFIGMVQGWLDEMYFVQLRSVQSEGLSEALQSHLGASSYNIHMLRLNK